ncbi:hypothetical protein B0H13DRAFT_1544188, partial [Mycena leptocephala]
ACLGAEFPWDKPSILDSYPLAIHRPGSRFNPGYNLLSVDLVNSVLRVRSRRCNNNPVSHGTGCSSCLGLGPEINVVHAWAQEAAGKKPNDRLSTNWKRSSMSPIRNSRMSDCRYGINTVRFQSLLTSPTTVNTWHAPTKEFRILLDLISSKDVPGLPRLLSNAKNEGWSTSKISSQVSLAVEGKYHPRNYTSLDV